MVDALEIGYAVKRRRAELSLTQEQVAQVAGVSKRCLWSIELGENSGVQLDKLTAVLAVLELDLVLVEGGAAATRETKKSGDVASVSSTEPVGDQDFAAVYTPDTIDALAILTGGK